MLKFTEKAQERVKLFLEQEEGALALRVAVAPGSPLTPHYELSLVEDWQQSPDDVELDCGGFKVLVDPNSTEQLEGATVDWVETFEGGGFKVENPNIKPLGQGPPEGPLADKVKHVIEQQINPAVAGHGGRITLVDTRDKIVYVQLDGGCQGCGMAAVTLKQGIERMIKQAVPEVEEIVDVTDHASGANPYFESEK